MYTVEAVRTALARLGDQVEKCITLLEHLIEGFDIERIDYYLALEYGRPLCVPIESDAPASKLSALPLSSFHQIPNLHMPSKPDRHQPQKHSFRQSRILMPLGSIQVPDNPFFGRKEPEGGQVSDYGPLYTPPPRCLLVGILMSPFSCSHPFSLYSH